MVNNRIKRIRENLCHLWCKNKRNPSPLTFQNKMNKEIWSKILNIVITVLTAIATTFGVTSCMGV